MMSNADEQDIQSEKLFYDIVNRKYAWEDKSCLHLLSIFYTMHVNASIDKDRLIQATLDCVSSISKDMQKYSWFFYSMRAFSEWVNNHEESAKSLLVQALHEDGERTSLLFLLICLRLRRWNEATAWRKYYFDLNTVRADQVPDNIEIILKALVAGLFDKTDGEECAAKIEEWCEKLSHTGNFSQNIDIWKNILKENNNEKTLPIYNTFLTDYPNLQCCLSINDEIRQNLRNAYLYENTIALFENIRKLKSPLLERDEKIMLLMYSLIFDYGTVTHHQQNLLDKLTTIISANNYNDAFNVNVKVKQYVFTLLKSVLQKAYARVEIENLGCIPSPLHLLLNIPSISLGRESVSVRPFTKDLTFQRLVNQEDEQTLLLKSYDQYMDTWNTEIVNKYSVTERDYLKLVLAIVYVIGGLLIFYKKLWYVDFGQYYMQILALTLIYYGGKTIDSHWNLCRKNKKILDVMQNKYAEIRQNCRRNLLDFFVDLTHYRHDFNVHDGKGKDAKDIGDKMQNYLEALQPEQYLDFVNTRIATHGLHLGSYKDTHAEEHGNWATLNNMPKWSLQPGFEIQRM